MNLVALSFQQECIFKKMSDNTSLRVYWSGQLRLSHCDNCCKRWYFTFNGVECSAPAAIDAVVYMRYGTGSRLKICIAHVTSRESAIKSTKAPSAWDSGSETVQVTVLLMRTQDGTRCPGSWWKKYLPRKLKKSRFKFFINLEDFLTRFLAVNVIIVK